MFGLNLIELLRCVFVHIECCEPNVKSVGVYNVARWLYILLFFLIIMWIAWAIFYGFIYLRHLSTRKGGLRSSRLSDFSSSCHLKIFYINANIGLLQTKFLMTDCFCWKGRRKWFTLMLGALIRSGEQEFKCRRITDVSLGDHTG